MAEALGQEEAALTWSGRAVDIGRIESELVRLRHEAAGGETFAIRTSLLNLVVYAADEGVARHAAQVIAGLSSRHPSRALIVVAKPSAAESRIDVQLAAHCHVSAGLQQQVCCEEVTLKVSGRAAHHLHSIIIPLLVSDLPVYIWWTGALPRDPHIFEEMMGAADRFIVDSARFARPAEAMARLARLCTERPICAVGDLSWGRLAPWRQLLAQHCDTPDLRPCLEPVTSVEIRFAEGGRRQKQPSQLFLLLGWLAARFGWETEGVSVGKSGGSLILPSRGGRVAVSVGAGATCEGLEPGWLASVSLRGGGEQGHASLSINMTDDPLHLAVHIEEPDTVLEGRVRIEACDEGEMLARELDTFGHDAEYEEALRRALPLLEATR